MKTLRDLFLAELATLYDAEARAVIALPKLAKAATCDRLKGALLSHLKETEGHVTKLDRVFSTFGEKAVGKTCEGMVGLLREADEIAAAFVATPALNAALIAAAQKIEHYETASYGCLQEWAGILDQVKASALLQDILEEEKSFNESLTELAQTRSNDEALGQAGVSDTH